MKIYKISKNNFKQAGVEPKVGKEFSLQLGKKGKQVKAKISKIGDRNIFAEVEEKKK